MRIEILCVHMYFEEGKYLLPVNQDGRCGVPGLPGPFKTKLSLVGGTLSKPRSICEFDNSNLHKIYSQAYS